MSLSDRFKQDVNSPVLQSEVSTNADNQRRYEDDAALKILAQDVETGDADKTIKEFTQMWTYSDELYQSPWRRNTFYNSVRANVPDYTLSDIIDVITTKIHSAIFYDTPAFMLRPNPKMDQKVLWAKTAVVQTQLREMEFDVEVGKGLEQCALLGTQIYKWGWESSKKVVPTYRSKAEPAQVETPLGTKSIDTPESDDFELVNETQVIERPWLKWKDLKHLLVNPGCQLGDIRKAGWVVDRDYATFDEIDQLRGIEGYDIPSREDLESLFFPPEGGLTPASGDISETRPINMRAWLAHSVGREINTSADPFARKLEILERWDDSKVIVALHNHKGFLLIRNKGNPFGCVPFLSSNWRNIPNNFYGQSLGQLVGPKQQTAQGIRNAMLDILAFIARPAYVRQKSFNVPSQNQPIDLGSVISVEGPVGDAFKLLEQPKVDQSLMAGLSSALSEAANTSGANELVGQGNSLSGSHATGMRSGTGAQAVVAAQASRLDAVISKFIRQVFIPWLYKMDELNAERLPTSVLRDILGADQEHDYTDFSHVEFRNTRADYEVLAGTQLGARKEMTQLIPFVMQIVNTPSMLEFARQAGETFDFDGFFKWVTDLGGYKYKQSFFKKMSPEQLQQSTQNSPAAIQQIKVQGAQQLQAQKAQLDLQKQDAANLGRAGNEVIRQALEKAMTPLAVEGQTSNQGLGDTE